MRRRIRNFGPLHRLWEEIQVAATLGDWPILATDSLGLTPGVTPVHHHVTLDQPLGLVARLRVGFAADWHAGPTTSDRTMLAAIEHILAADPDVVLLGGDFVSLRARYGNRLVPLFRRLNPRAGIFAVLGNHDHYAGAEVVGKQLEDAGVVLLENRNAPLPEPFDQVSVVGLADHISGEPDAERAFSGARPVRLLLMHQPSGLLDVNGDRFDLAFAGHTHGGQILLPWGPPLIMPKGKLSRRYRAGRFDTERGPLLVSRGVGCTLLPIRWNASADVVIADLTGPAQR